MPLLGSAATSTSQKQQQQQQKPPGNTIAPDDISLPQPPGGMDGISSLTWSPKANTICSSGWDGFVRCWDVQESMGQLSALPRAQVHHEGHSPVLSSAFSSDGNFLFSGGADKAVRMWNLGQSPLTGIPQQIGVHDAPVRHVAFVPTMNCVVSGGWDKKLIFWDARSSSPVKQLDLPGKCYALDLKGSLLAVATAGNHIISYDVGQGKPREKRRQKSPSNLGTSLRCISVFPDSKGYVVGGIQGRMHVENFLDKSKEKTYSFKCHSMKDDTSITDVYSVNHIAFHPTSNPNPGILASVGSDGGINFWSKATKQRVKEFPRIKRPVSCASFNAKGDIFAYASSYDWSRGSAFYAQGHPNEIYLHQVLETEIKTKPKKPKLPTGRRKNYTYR